MGAEGKCCPVTEGLELHGHVMPIPLPFCFSFFPPFFFIPFPSFSCTLIHPEQGMGSPWEAVKALVPQAVAEACRKE